jgi:hypothetical protein
MELNLAGAVDIKVLITGVSAVTIIASPAA